MLYLKMREKQTLKPNSEQLLKITVLNIKDNIILDCKT